MARALACAATFAVALATAAPAGAEQPPAPLVRAELRTARVSSLRFATEMSIRVAGQTVTVTTAGVERVKAHQASMVVGASPLNPSLGTARVLVIGPRSYTHYAVLDALHAKRPQIKPWIVSDSSAVDGVDPWSLVDLPSSLGAASGYRLLRTSNGLSRYAARLDLRAAIESHPQLKQLLPRSAIASGVPSQAVPFTADVGGDGYIHAVTEHLALSDAGQSISVTAVLRLSDFDHDPGPIAAPASDQVMTLAQFTRLAKG